MVVVIKRTIKDLIHGTQQHPQVTMIATKTAMDINNDIINPSINVTIKNDNTPIPTMIQPLRGLDPLFGPPILLKVPAKKDKDQQYGETQKTFFFFFEKFRVFSSVLRWEGSYDHQ
ncbi:hypothetical protein XENOCAPTIV_016937 [Xenoophorus captivus]|uniref:Uncharacterized protein n=1 Tax=Xenoophorus captivus TaxID=1517983 RepID=A0ABV0RUE5_9TELE